MTWLIVVVCILLALLLLGQIRIGAAVAYSELGLFLNLKIGPFHIQVVPAKQKKKKAPKKGKKSQRKHPAEEGAQAVKPKRKIKDTLSLALRFIPVIAKAAGQLLRKIRIDNLELHIIWGASDPASAAKGFGAGNAAMGMLWPILEHNFKVKKHDLSVDVDFEQTKPTIDAQAQATLTIGQTVSFALRLGLQALKIYLGYRREIKK